MFTVSAPENNYIKPIETRTLKTAIKEKYALMVNRKGCHAIITDQDGYVVSTREQQLYVIQNLV